MSEITPTIATPENTSWFNDEMKTWKQVEDGPTVFTSARRLAGNMSPGYNQVGEALTKEEKVARAGENLQDLLESSGLHPENAFIMLPQQKWDKLGVVNVDEVYTPGEHNDKPTIAPEPRADLIITRNPDTILITRPADCPVLTINGTDRDGNAVLAQLHVGWQGLNAGFLENGIRHIIEEEAVDMASLRIQMSGAGYAETFHYSNGEHPLDDESYEIKDGEKRPKRFTHPQRNHLFVNHKEAVKDDGSIHHEFDMDMPGFIRFKLQDMGIDNYQLFEEGSDTSSPDSGYSSHRRDGGIKREGSDQNVDNTRDAVVSTLAVPDQSIIRRFYIKKRAGAALRSV